MQTRFKTSKTILKYIIFGIAILLIFIAIPKEGKFKFEFELNQPWQHEDLVAPFTFPIKKTERQINEEKQDIKNSFNPFFDKDTTIRQQVIYQFRNNKRNLVRSGFEKLDPSQREFVCSQCEKLINRIYDRGVLVNEESLKGNSKDLVLNIVSGKILEEIPADEVFTLFSAKTWLAGEISKDYDLKNFIAVENLAALLKADLSYSKELSDAKLKNLLENISPNKGIVAEGDKIISKGNIVTPEKFQMLESLRSEYKTSPGKGKINYLLYSSYLVFILLIFTGFIIYMAVSYKELFKSLKNLMLIFTIMTVFIVISSLIVRYQTMNIYVIPLCILPIVLISFFDRNISFFTFLVTIVVISLFAPNNYEFLLIEMITGLTIILAISKVRYLSKFILIALTVLGLYVLTYTCFKLLQVSSFSELDYKTYLWFTGNFALTLLAYPMIYIFEKLFGFVSDITLIELSDLNKKLLHELSLKAPGTFQHSLQVANIAEAVISRIGGNPLLARVGALYHDIGKIYAPQYFIENQKIFNPHNTLDEPESAKKITDHVIKGAELARQYNLPREISSFIRTHHGTTRTEYFYRNYIKKFPDEQVNDSVFRYPGPKPVSRENAVVMIADSIEAASRTLKEPTEQMINELVDRVIDQKLNDRQFENAMITFREINVTREIIKKLMISIYHGRIEYPEPDKN